MADRIVLDASAALAVLRAEPASVAVRRTLEELPSGEGSILVPEQFWLEISNVLGRRYGWPGDAIVRAIRELDELGLTTVQADRPVVLLALDLMAAHDLTAYDALYLALAETEDAALVTLDADLAAAAGDRSALPGTGGIRERHAAYGPRVERPSWARHGRYLAALREGHPDELRSERGLGQATVTTTPAPAPVDGVRQPSAP